MLLTDKYADKIHGIITCYDRMIIQDISLNDHAVITGNDAMNFISVFISE